MMVAHPGRVKATWDTGGLAVAVSFGGQHGPMLLAAAAVESAPKWDAKSVVGT